MTLLSGSADRMNKMPTVVFVSVAITLIFGGVVTDNTAAGLGAIAAAILAYTFKSK